MKRNISKRNSGFTIIEVLIVLAIAGLIMLVVLLAVPGLQRSQANTAAKTDATHIAAGITDYTANNSGTLPTNTTMSTVYTNVAGLSKLTSTNGATGTLGTLPALPTTNTWYFNTGQVTGATQTTQIWVVDVDEGAVCPTGVTFAPTIPTTTTGATATSIVLLYTTETNGASNWNCLQVQ